jgi:hypothetical protein
VGRKRKNPLFRPRRFDLLRRLGATQPWQGYIHDDDVRVQLLSQLHALHAIIRLANQLQVALLAQQRGDASTQDGVIFNQDNPNLCGWALHWGNVRSFHC